MPTGNETLRWQVDVAAESGVEDRMRFAQRVEPAVPVRVWQSTLLQVDRAQALPVERPADALPERGGLEVALRPRLAGSRDAILRTIAHYAGRAKDGAMDARLCLGAFGWWLVRYLVAGLRADVRYTAPHGAGAEHGDRQIGLRQILRHAYFPSNFGLRFSMKARMPSF